MRTTTSRVRGVFAAAAFAGRSRGSLSTNPSLSLQTRLHVPPLRRNFQFPIVRAIHEAATAAANRARGGDGDDVKSEPDWKIKMLYDGDCPLCMREVEMLRERNEKYGVIKFVDISSDEYSPDENQGLEYETVMGKIHAIMSDGTVVTNVEAFRKLYEAVGLGWVYAITKYEPVATIADAVYNVWARYRLPITGRPPLEQVLEARKKKKEAACNDNGSCKM